MSLITLLVYAAVQSSAMSWRGSAEVTAGGRTIAIEVRSSIAADGTIISESWPTNEGEVRGLRRLVLSPDGTGSLERNGQRQALPREFVDEERAQFGFYLQLQTAAARCSASSQRAKATLDIEGPKLTRFLCSRRRIISATNWTRSDGMPQRQDFFIKGLRRDGSLLFPRRLVIRRGDRPFFDLHVTHFRSSTTSSP